MKNIWLFDYRKMSIRGILAIIAGCIAIFIPDLTMKSVVMTVGGLIFLVGAIGIIISLTVKEKMSWGAELTRTIPNLIIGLLLIIMPELFVKLMVIIIGVGLLLIGIVQLAGVFSVREIIGWSWFYLIMSLLIITSGIVMLNNPFKSAETIVTFFGIILIFYGISEVVISWKIGHAPEQHKGTDVHDIGHEEIR